MNGQVVGIPRRDSAGVKIDHMDIYAWIMVGNECCCWSAYDIGVSLLVDPELYNSSYPRNLLPQSRLSSLQGLLAMP